MNKNWQPLVGILCFLYLFLFISKIYLESSYWWLVGLVWFGLWTLIYFFKICTWKWRGRFILSFIPLKGKIIISVKHWIFLIHSSLAVDKIWIVSIYSKFLGLLLPSFGPSLGHLWAIFGPSLNHFIFNRHPVRAGQRMEHLTSHELFPSTLCTSH